MLNQGVSTQETAKSPYVHFEDRHAHIHVKAEITRQPPDNPIKLCHIAEDYQRVQRVYERQCYASVSVRAVSGLRRTSCWRRAGTQPGADRRRPQGTLGGWQEARANRGLRSRRPYVGTYSSARLHWADAHWQSGCHLTSQAREPLAYSITWRRSARPAAPGGEARDGAGRTSGDTGVTVTAS
eukprot:scaffold1402_cov403-Prasinococcus_capsulatus_cf.AAC.16